MMTSFFLTLSLSLSFLSHFLSPFPLTFSFSLPVLCNQTHKVWIPMLTYSSSSISFFHSFLLFSSFSLTHFFSLSLSPNGNCADEWTNTTQMESYECTIQLYNQTMMLMNGFSSSMFYSCLFLSSFFSFPSFFLTLSSSSLH